MAEELHLELILGRKVYDSENRPVGRLEEVVAEERGDELVVKEYLVGGTSMLQRLSVTHLGRKFLGRLPAKGNCYRVPWDKLDSTQTDKLRLHCAKDELESFSPQGEAKVRQSN
jgi:sporulation protein YlmC with PRC-barrel domain